MQVTRTKCTSNRKHKWKTVSKEYKADGKVYYVYAWCCQCGSLTEFVQELNGLERVLDKDNEYLITKPETVG
jgi:hypothetical protein